MLRVIAKGAKRTVVCAELPDGSSPAADFLDGLNEKKRGQMQVLFDRIAQTGQLRNKEKFKKIEGSDGFYEFKSFQTRVPCFFETGGLVVLTHGFTKKKDRMPPAEVDRATRVRTAWNNRKSGT